MSLPVEALHASALELSREDRAELAHRLIESLDEATDDPEEVDQAWRDEISRRLAALEAGEAELIPAEQVFAEVRRHLNG